MELALLRRPPQTFSNVFCIGPCQLALFEHVSTPDLLLLRVDAETRGWVEEYVAHERRVREVDVRQGVHVKVLRYLTWPADELICADCNKGCVLSHLADGDYQFGWHCDTKLRCIGEYHEPGTERWLCSCVQSDSCFACMPRETFSVAVDGCTVRLAAAVYDLGEGLPVILQTKGMKLLGEEGVAITRSGSTAFAVRVMAEDVVIEHMQLQNVHVAEGAKLRLQNCTVQGDSAVEDHGSAVSVEGTAIIQGCIIQDGQQGAGINVTASGVATVAGTTVRRKGHGVAVLGKATIGACCSITACTYSGLIAFQHEDGPGEVTVAGADLVCDNADPFRVGISAMEFPRSEFIGNFVSMQGGTIRGIAEEKIVST